MQTTFFSLGRFLKKLADDQCSSITICVAIGSIDCEIQSEKGMLFFCFENLSIAITLEPLVRFRWGFQQNVPLLMRISIKKKTENVTFSTSLTDSPRSHHIMYIQPFTTVVDWPEIECLVEVSTMFYICRYFFLYLYFYLGRHTCSQKVSLSILSHYASVRRLDKIHSKLAPLILSICRLNMDLMKS